MEFYIGDKVIYNSKPYKVVHIYDNEQLKLQSIKSKTNQIIFKVPFYLVRKKSN